MTNSKTHPNRPLLSFAALLLKSFPRAIARELLHHQNLTQQRIDRDRPIHDSEKAIAKVSIVGAGMVGNPRVAAQFFSALAAEKINIQMITTSEIKISCVVAEDQAVKALQAVHTAFGLSKK